MTKVMTRRMIWRKVAGAFDENPNSIVGLCAVYRDIAGGGESSIYGRMNNLRGAMKIKSCYWWPCNAEHAPLRATFAGLMAAMTDRERDQLEPGL